MGVSYHFDEIAKLPLPGDNVAIATQLIEAGTTIDYAGQTLTTDYTILEGHRFAVKAIASGEALLSWELPFGVALRPIHPGSYVINQNVSEALRDRSLNFALPMQPNFTDHVEPFVVDERTFRPAPAPIPYPETRTFMGYRRSSSRGVGTRNTIVLLGTTSRTGSYVKQLAKQLQGELTNYPNLDGIVPVAHTEGGAEKPNNLELLLRTLAGFMVNPNVGAVLAVDYGIEQVTNAMLESYMREHGYPLEEVPHRFLSLSGSLQDQLTEGEAIVRGWLPIIHAMERTPESISHLKIGLQCGGSDAFSGISANPLLGWVAQELIRYGGAASLAETDELIGAESYVLQKVRDLETARKFLAFVATFKERTAWHGQSAEGNPSGGNIYRGLYNIELKSIGAARKKDPTTRLDYAIDYGERMREGGYYFMDSPGNDLESIAGQVASGCNMIMFTTGNGSVTNFPFVPTVKVVTTTHRFQLLVNDMDVNAGQFQDGLSMEQLGRQTFDLTLHVASGQRSVGEKAGHSQVQIWRNWQQTDGAQLESLHQDPAPIPAGMPIPIMTNLVQNPVASRKASRMHFTFNRYDGRIAGDQIGLILPTSLCSGQIANLIAMRLNEKKLGQPEHLSRFVALAHTEGCGASSGDSEQMVVRTMIGYANHPLVKYCLLLEHGCEKTHNDYMRHHIEEIGGDVSRLGFASIQLDGGIDKVTEKVEAWFADQVAASEPSTHETVGLEALRIGIMCDGLISAAAAEQLAALTKLIVGAGGRVIVPANSGLLSASNFTESLSMPVNVLPSLSYGEHARHAGFHVMETPTRHWVETMTGLAATGVELIVALVHERPMQTHPFVPVLQMASEPTIQQSYTNDLDLLLGGHPDTWIDQILDRIQQVIEHHYEPVRGHVDFQFTRGLFGVSL